MQDIWSYVDSERRQPTPPNMECVDSVLHERALQKWQRGKDDSILCLMDNLKCLFFVNHNLPRLIARGTYEKCLISAFIGTRTNNGNWTQKDLEYFFSLANRRKLLMAGDKLPDGDEFILYRGVAGIGNKRRIRGISWTSDLERAKWFANRWKEFLPNPAVYMIKVKRDQILAYCNDRNENEFLIIPKPHMKIQQVV